MNVSELEPIKEDFRQKALKCYSFAQLKADKGLISANPTRLSVALNFSVFHWDCMEDRDEALKLAKKAREVGQKTLEKLDDEDEVTDTTKILEMLRWNIDDWEEIIKTEEEEIRRSGLPRLLFRE